MARKWTPAQRKKFQATVLAKKRKAAKPTQSIPLEAIPDRRPSRTKTVSQTWSATVPLRNDENALYQAKLDILFGLITLAHKVLK